VVGYGDLETHVRKDRNEGKRLGRGRFDDKRGGWGFHQTFDAEKGYLHRSAG